MKPSMLCLKILEGWWRNCQTTTLQTCAGICGVLTETERTPSFASASLALELAARANPSFDCASVLERQFRPLLDATVIIAHCDAVVPNYGKKRNAELISNCDPVRSARLASNSNHPAVQRSAGPTNRPTSRSLYSNCP